MTSPYIANLTAPMSGEGSLSCHTSCDTGPRFCALTPLID